jgi:hypothetical protein
MGILDSWLELLGLSGGSMWCERKSVYVRGVSGWWIDANTSCHLQLYFFVSVFPLGLVVYQVWFSSCVTRWPNLRRLFVKM